MVPSTRLGNRLENTRRIPYRQHQQAAATVSINYFQDLAHETIFKTRTRGGIAKQLARPFCTLLLRRDLTGKARGRRLQGARTPLVSPSRAAHALQHAPQVTCCRGTLDFCV